MTQPPKPRPADISERITRRAQRLKRAQRLHPDLHEFCADSIAKVRYYRGEAEHHSCCCGETAAEWCIANTRHIEGSFPLAYSDSIGDYSALCAACALHAESVLQDALRAMHYGPLNLSAGR